MTIKEINDMVNDRTQSVPRTNDFYSPHWYARFFMAEGIIMSGVNIEPCEEPTLKVTKSCYKMPFCDDEENAAILSIEVGSRQEPYPSHTIFFIQLRHENSNVWETHISNVYEDRFTDIDYLSVQPHNCKVGDIYEVRIKKWDD